MASSNAIDLLKADHEAVKRLLAELVETTSRARKKRADLLAEIKKELAIHTALEEEIFYPAFSKTDGAEHRQMYFEAKQEHRAVESLVLPDLEKTDVTGDEFIGRAKVLQELIEHHAAEEEHEMFPKAAKAFSKDELNELGKRIQQRKAQLQKA